MRTWHTQLLSCFYLNRARLTVGGHIHTCRAQAEIDAVIGYDRSPQWSDFPKLPYINMMIKEAHRWRPVLPLGVVHGLSEGERPPSLLLPAPLVG